MVRVFESQGFVVLAVPFRAFIHVCCLPLSLPTGRQVLSEHGPQQKKINQLSFIPARSSHTKR